MLNKRQTHFTTGEMAKIFNVSKHTLFHYDEMGIFSPEIVDDNNYRYYSFAQLDVFYVISNLKKLGMSLKDIRAYLDRRSPSELISLLQKEEEIINQKIKELQTLKQVIHHRALMTKEASTINPDSISVEWMDKKYYMITEAMDYANAKNGTISLGKHYAARHDYEIESPHSIGGILDLTSILDGHYTDYKYFFTEIEAPLNHLPIYERATGTYLIGYHTGGYDLIGETYQKLIDYAAKRNLQLRGDFFEDLLLDDLSVKGYENYLLKLWIRVEH